MNKWTFQLTWTSSGFPTYWAKTGGWTDWRHEAMLFDSPEEAQVYRFRQGLQRDDVVYLEIEVK